MKAVFATKFPDRAMGTLPPLEIAPLIPTLQIVQAWLKNTFEENHDISYANAVGTLAFHILN